MAYRTSQSVREPLAVRLETLLQALPWLGKENL
jgi:hypothetical protein